MPADDRSRTARSSMAPPCAAGASDPRAAELDAAKDLVRSRVRRARADQSEDRRRAADAVRTRLAHGALEQLPGGLPSCVACYLSIAPEPGTGALIELLRQAGVQVLVPLLRGRHEPTFARYTGAAGLRPGLWGIPEPRDPEVVPLTQADLVLCSALAATPDGRRLGVGGGWYDRALRMRRPGVPAWALLNDAEVVATLPTGSHDEVVDVLVTEERVLACHA